MKTHYQIYTQGVWLTVDPEDFWAYASTKRYGPIGRETYIYPDGTSSNPCSFLTSNYRRYDHI